MQQQFCGHFKSFHFFQLAVFTCLLIFSHLLSFCLVCYVHKKYPFWGKEENKFLQQDFKNF